MRGAAVSAAHIFDSQNASFGTTSSLSPDLKRRDILPGVRCALRRCACRGRTSHIISGTSKEIKVVAMSVFEGSHIRARWL